jgi:hypothetical protein
MDTNEAIRQRVLRLLDHGVSQKVLSKKMGLSQTWFSRWVNQKQDLVIPVSAMDGFARFVKEFSEALHDPAGGPAVDDKGGERPSVSKQLTTLKHKGSEADANSGGKAGGDARRRVKG